MQFTTTTCSEKGPREEQQDAAGAVAMTGRLLAVVCDGAGGHRGGSLASKVGVAAACRAFEKARGRFADPKAALLNICKSAHEEILTLGETPKLAPRSTMAVLYLDTDKAHWVHVGDSRIYRLRAGKILERTRDHTMVQILFEQGEVQEAEMGTHPDQGRLLRALGTEEEPRPAYGSADLAENDSFLLCSDGFWERTPPMEIEMLFREEPTQARLERLVHLAMERNGPKGDNVTALVVSPEPSKGGPSAILWPFLLLLLLVVVLLCWLLVFPPFQAGDTPSGQKQSLLESPQ